MFARLHTNATTSSFFFFFFNDALKLGHFTNFKVLCLAVSMALCHIACLK